MKQQRKLDARDYDLWVYVWWGATYFGLTVRATSVACRFIGSEQASQLHCHRSMYVGREVGR